MSSLDKFIKSSEFGKWIARHEYHVFSSNLEEVYKHYKEQTT